jgi:hypothetical protein
MGRAVGAQESARRGAKSSGYWPVRWMRTTERGLSSPRRVSREVWSFVGKSSGNVRLLRPFRVPRWGWVGDLGHRVAQPQAVLLVPVGDARVARIAGGSCVNGDGLGPRGGRAVRVNLCEIPCGISGPGAPESALPVDSKGVSGRAPKHGGEGGIRTHGTLAGTPVFKTGAINRSTTSPWRLGDSGKMAWRAGRAS